MLHQDPQFYRVVEVYHKLISNYLDKDMICGKRGLSAMPHYGEMKHPLVFDLLVDAHFQMRINYG